MSPACVVFNMCVCVFVCMWVSVCVFMSTIPVRNSFNGFFWNAFDRILLSLIRSGNGHIIRTVSCAHFGKPCPLYTHTFLAVCMSI